MGDTGANGSRQSQCPERPGREKEEEEENNPEAELCTSLSILAIESAKIVTMIKIIKKIIFGFDPKRSARLSFSSRFF